MLESEAGVIGCTLLDTDSLFSVYNKLKPDMFSDGFCHDTYEEILGMYDVGEDITLPSLVIHLENKYERPFIMENLKYCLGIPANHTEIKSFANTIIQEFKSREVKALFQRVSTMPKDIDETIGEMLTRLEELQTSKEIPFKTLSQIVDENRDNYFNEQVGQGLIKTGFYKLDDCMGGLEGGDITVIGARPAVGKSAFVTQIIGNVAKKHKKVGYFNLEMNENQVYERFLAKESGIDLVRIRRAKAFLGGEDKQFNDANDLIRNYNVIISTGGKTVSEIRAISRHQRFDLIVIDYLQLIKADRKYSNRASEVGDISKSIKALAMELKVPIILLSQLNRLSAHADDKEPDMSELRESGDIEQDASNILLLWNLGDDDNHFKGLKIEKQRQGELIKEALVFDGQYMNFTECDRELWQMQDAIKKNKKGKKSSDSIDGDLDF